MWIWSRQSPLATAALLSLALASSLISQGATAQKVLANNIPARAPYFHNSIAKTHEDVVVHYEVALGFQFTPQERKDLGAFMEAL